MFVLWSCLLPGEEGTILRPGEARLPPRQPHGGNFSPFTQLCRGNFFEIKFIAEQFASTTAAYEEIQNASLEQRKILARLFG